MNTRSSFLMGLLLASSASAAAQDVKQLPMAMVVGFDQYRAKEQLPALKFARSSAAGLASRFAGLGYETRFITGSESVDATKREFQVKPVRVQVQKADTGKELTASVLEWIDRAAKAEVPLAFLILVGHGVVREDTTFLLAGHDTPKEGGLSLDEIKEKSKEHRLPLVVVYDACRRNMGEGGAGAAGARAVAADPETGSSGQPDWVRFRGVGGGSGSGLLRIVRGSGPQIGEERAGYYPTILYSTRAGDTAIDSKDDLVGHLATVLDMDQDVQQILALTHPEWRLQPRFTLLHWFDVAVGRLARTTKMKQIHDLYEGQVPIETVLFDYSPQDKKLSDRVKRVFEEVNLTDCLGSTSGDFECVPHPLGGFVITRPDRAANNNYFVQTRLEALGTDGTVSGIRPDKKILILDVVATPPEGISAQAAGGQMTFEIHPKYNKDINRPKPISLANDAFPYTVKYGIRTLLVIPLLSRPDAVLNELGISVIKINTGQVPSQVLWPSGASLRVLSLRVSSQPGVAIQKPTAQEFTPNLLAHWFPVDRRPGAPKGQNLEVDRIGTKGGPQVVLKQKGGEAWVGGELYPPVFVPEGCEIVVDAGTSDSSAALTLQVIAGNEDDDPKALVDSEIKIGSKRGAGLVAGGGQYVHYLAVRTKAKQLTLRGLTVVPAPAPKKNAR